MKPSLAPWSTRRPSVEQPPGLVVGCMNFGKRTLEADAREIVERALDLGVTHFDTANAYVEGESERILGRALRGRREQAVVATKVGLSRVGGSTSGLISAGGRSEGLSAAHIVAALEASLERLGTDYVDLYYLHVPDGATPIEESLTAIERLLRAGKIRAWGVSNYASWQVLEMMTLADGGGFARPAMAQQIYNLLVRQLDVEYFAFASRYGFHTAVYNPLAGGLLAGPAAAGAPPAGSRFDANPMYQRRYLSDPLRARAARYADVAADLGLSPLELAYGWLASRREVDSILVGPATAAHLEDAVSAVQKRLAREDCEAIDRLHCELEGTDARYARL